jgi:hypothetical protein
MYSLPSSLNNRVELTQNIQQERSPHLSPPPRHERSQPPQASQLDLLVLLGKSFEPPLKIEPVPVNVTVGFEQRFWLVHQPTGLRILGQFTYNEAQEILELTAKWDWEVDPVTREPACCYQLMSLLERICKPKKVLECAV